MSCSSTQLAERSGNRLQGVIRTNWHCRFSFPLFPAITMTLEITGGASNPAWHGEILNYDGQGSFFLTWKRPPPGTYTLKIVDRESPSCQFQFAFNL